MGSFFTFEGAEATGKSTIIKIVAEHIKNKGHEVIVTREPGGTKLAESIRNIIFHNGNSPSVETELLLMFASRRDHIENIIAPALEDSKIILCDRFIDSSYVYQGDIGGIDSKKIDRLCDDFVKPYLPDFTFYISADIDIIYKRLLSRGHQNRYDELSKDQIHNMVKKFEKRHLAQEKSVLIENNHNIEECCDKIIDRIISII